MGSNRARTLRNHADCLELAMIQRGTLFILANSTGDVVHTGGIDATEEFVAANYKRRPAGPPPLPVPEMWSPWIEMFADELRAARRAAGTVRMRRLVIAKFARSRPDHDPLTVSRDDLVQYLSANFTAELGADVWAASYSKTIRTTFRLFFAMLTDLGHRSDNPAGRLPNIALPRALPRPIPDSALVEGVRGAENPAVKLALRIATETGARRAEIARTRRDDVEGSPGKFWLRILGKGGHQRTVPLSDDLARVLMDSSEVFVFPARDRWGKIVEGHVSEQHLGKLTAAVLPDNWTLHTVRHRYATLAYEASKDIRAVQELLGHASPVTTAMYTRVANESLRAAASAAHIDFESCTKRPAADGVAR